MSHKLTLVQVLLADILDRYKHLMNPEFRNFIIDLHFAIEDGFKIDSSYSNVLADYLYNVMVREDYSEAVIKASLGPIRSKRTVLIGFHGHA